VTGVGCGMVGGARVCHPVGHGCGGAGVIELRQQVRDYGSHSPNHSIKGSDCCGGGSMNEGPTSCTGKPY
jgi:hypothetical protein